jgi:hypothetical protein
METIGIVLNVERDRAAEFEAGFREQELPIWQDYCGRGVLTTATLSRLEISSARVEGAVQYLVVAIFATGEGHQLHDDDPRFHAWNERADIYQVAEPLVFGGETIITAAVANGSPE